MHSLSQGPNIIIFVLSLINNESIRDAEDSVDSHKTECNTHRRCSFIFWWKYKVLFHEKSYFRFTDQPNDWNTIRPASHQPLIQLTR